MKKRNGGIRTVFTAGVLLVLVIAAVWTLKHRKAEDTAEADIKIETPQVTEVTPEPAEEPEEEQAEPAEDADETARQEQVLLKYRSSSSTSSTSFG